MAWIEADVVNNCCTNRVLEPVQSTHCMSGSCQVPYPVLYMCSRVPRTTPVLILCFALTVLCRSGDQLKTGEDVGALMTVNDVVWTQCESRGGPTHVSVCNG